MVAVPGRVVGPSEGAEVDDGGDDDRHLQVRGTYDGIESGAYEASGDGGGLDGTREESAEQRDDGGGEDVHETGGLASAAEELEDEDLEGHHEQEHQSEGGEEEEPGGDLDGQPLRVEAQFEEVLLLVEL